MRQWILVILFAVALFPMAATAQQNIKLGTIDLNRIFESYYKKQDAEKRIKEQTETYNNERKIYLDGVKKIMDEMNKLRAEAGNQSYSKDVQDEKKKAFMLKGAEYEQRMRDLQEFDGSRRRQIADAMQRMRDNLLEEIMKVVNDKAKAEGYTMIFDRSGKTANGAPAVPYAVDAIDMSEGVIKALNATASSKPEKAEKEKK
ncbi:MAG: OmpH family outer membrane protein [Verrucomicrobiae bacterium]|nr:OmpH family outer membrane protein [Verrucomicrobiae bacterium]